MPRLVFLWTDVLIWLLVVLTVLFVLQVRKSPQMCEAWRRVAQSRTALSATVVLGAYIIVGLADSIHFNPRIESVAKDQTVYSPEVLSLLDVLATGLRERAEKTYSAPLATHAFNKETVELPDGTKVRAYPRLLHGGAHLKDLETEWLADVLARGVGGALLGTLVWFALLSLIVFLKGRHAKGALLERLRPLLSGATELPWHAALWTLLLLFVLCGAVMALSAHYHVLGTDKVGQDVFYQAVKSIRTGLVIGTLTTLVMLPAAILLGIMAGYFRGWVDDFIQYLYTTLNSIPSVLLIAAAVLMMHLYMNTHADQFNSVTERADLRLLFLCVILGVTSWTGLCRLLRGETFKLRELEYVQAAQAMGVRHFKLLYRHVLPNVMHIVLITVVLDFSGLVLAEAVLSYINIGVDPNTESWGNMINGARLELAREPVVWWSLIAAFVFMFTLVLAANLFADRVRDAFDPRLRSVR
jgi:peptide/nickel transport system permease protein